MKKKMRSALCLLLAAILSFAFAGEAFARSESEIVQEMIMDYGYYQNEADASIEILLAELEKKNASHAALWREIMDYWKYTATEMEIRYASLPDDLDQTDALCLIVLGFHLMPDGSIRPELEARLETALNCAMQYPNSYVLCTGGGTATRNSKAKEAMQMAKWLYKHGLPKERLIIEDGSKTTGENAIKSYNIIRKKYPQIKYAAIISTDYHIPWGSTLFQAEFLIGAAKNGGEPIQVVTHAAARYDDHQDYPFYYAAGGLMELIGQKKKANKIYEHKAHAPKLRG